MVKPSMLWATSKRCPPAKGGSKLEVAANKWGQQTCGGSKHVVAASKR